MRELTRTIPILSTPQELEQAVQRYRSRDLNDPELLFQWQAIRDASLNQYSVKPDGDEVFGEDSY